MKQYFIANSSTNQNENYDLSSWYIIALILIVFTGVALWTGYVIPLHNLYFWIGLLIILLILYKTLC